MGAPLCRWCRYATNLMAQNRSLDARPRSTHCAGRIRLGPLLHCSTGAVFKLEWETQLENRMKRLSFLILIAGCGWAQTPPAKAPAQTATKAPTGATGAAAAPARAPGLYAIFNTS